MPELKEGKVKEKKPFYKRWWFIAIVALFVLSLFSSLGDNDKGNASNPPESSANVSSVGSPAPTASAAPSEAPTTPTTINFNAELSSGHYTAGIDFPAGKYDIEAVAGGGNVISDNAFSGGINAVLGVAEKNQEIGTDMYEQKYSNIDLPEGAKLSISGVTVKISSDNASGTPLQTRNQAITETIDLGNGNFVAGTDFPAGIYDIVAVSGGGNVNTDNMMNGGINAVLGVSSKNQELGSDMYEQEYKNVEFPEGTTITISGVQIQLVPSK